MTVVPLAQGTPNGAVVMHFNISERKRAEEERRESEERFSSAFEDAPIGVALVSLAGRCMRVNRALCDLLGYTKSEMLARTFQDITYPEDLEAELENIRRLIAGEAFSYQMEKRNVHARGHLIEVSLNVSLVRDRLGRPSYFIGQVQDISDRKRAEEVLRRASRQVVRGRRTQIRFELLLLVLSTAAFFGLALWFNWLESATAWVLSLATDKLDEFVFAMIFLVAGLAVFSIRRWRESESELTARDQSLALTGLLHDELERRVRERTEELDRANQALGAEITERKKSEDALRGSEEEFRTLAEAVPQMVFTNGPEGGNIYFSQQWMDYTGLTPQESRGHGWNRSFHPDDQPEALAAWRDASTASVTYSIECRLRRADGEYRWWLIRGVPVKDAAGRVLKWFGTCTDIHDLKVAELEIARSNRVYAMLSGINALTVRATDRDELFREACRIAVEAGGFQMALIAVVEPGGEAILPVASAGKDKGLIDAINSLLSSLDRAPDTMLARSIREKRPIVSNDSQNDAQVLLQKMYASVRSIAILPLLIEDRGVGAIALYSGEIDFFHDEEMKLLTQLAEDIAFCMGALLARTGRDLADEALRKSLKDKEALLKEVHHRVKNNMQVISSLLRLESNRIDHPATRSVLKDMQNRIHAMAALHEALYRSDDFTQVDLAVCLTRLTNQLSRSLSLGPGHVAFRLDLLSVGLGLDQAIPCGLIVNELVSNALKHGFPAGRSGEVRVELRRVDERSLRLTVSDDGIGLPADFETRRGKSLGLQLVSDLARQLRGELRVGLGPHSVFEVTFEPDSNSPR